MYPVVNLGMEIYSTIEDWNKERNEMLQILRDRLKEAQNCIKQNANKRRVDKEY